MCVSSLWQAGLKSREELKAELEDRERTTKDGKKDSAASTSTPLALGGGATLQLGSAEAEKDADDIDAANVQVGVHAQRHPHARSK